MPSANSFQTNFSAGELSPRLYARVDISKYANGCQKVENFVIQRFGGAKKRPGTEFIREVKDSAKKVRLVPFIFSLTQSYILEFGDFYIRIYTSGGRLESPPGTPVEVVTPYTQNQIFQIQYTQSADVLYLVHPSHPPMKLSRLGLTSFTLTPFAFRDGPFLPVNTTATTLQPEHRGNWMRYGATTTGTGTTPAAATDNDKTTNWVNTGTAGNIVISQTSGIGKVVDSYYIIAHSKNALNDMPTSWIVSGSNDNVTYATLDGRDNQTGWDNTERRFYTFANKVPYKFLKLEISGGGGADGDGAGLSEFGPNEAGDDMTPFNITASSTNGINDNQGFLASDVGRQIRIRASDGRTRWCTIVSRASTTVVTVRMYGQALPDLAAITNWSMGAWSTVTGFPACIGFYVGRLVFARTDLEPQTVWFSRVDQLNEFGGSVPVQDDDGITATITSDTVNIINWVAEGTDLFIGTTAAVRTIGPTTGASAFSPTNLKQKRENNYGAGPLQPVRVGSTALYSGYYGRDIRELAYSFDYNGYISNDLSLLSEHIPSSAASSPMVQMAYTQNPDSIVWAVSGKNDLFGMTYERDQDVIAFHRHTLGGVFESGPTLVDSVASIPGLERDELWLVVRRTINGAQKRYVERLSIGLSDSSTTLKSAATYVDSFLGYTGASTSTISGLSHLIGQQVMVWDGAKQGPFTVSGGGTITLTTAVTKCVVGLPYTSKVETLSPEAAAQMGTAQTRLGNITEVFVRVNRSMNGTLGPSNGLQEKLEYEKDIDLEGVYGNPLELYTGDVRVPISMAWERGRRIRIVHSEPSPFHVLGLISEIKVSG